ncbi:alpha/beta hydrolase [Actinoplanes sp. NPDC051851]|uniref:alpha/beta fold hydrolase n=1 Tax=Actinoplanes sp. NPDC051851 TaxID=3154753 RepID=UPI00344AA05C
MNHISLPDGRVLEYVVEGPDTGLPLVYHHGTPGSAEPLAPLSRAAAKHGLRLIVATRAGYGPSTAHPGRTVGDVAADTAALLDALGAGTFVTAGHSGGGPHALACAALLPERCLGAATIAGVAPYGKPDLDFLDGMAPENVTEFGAALTGPEELSAFLVPEAAGLARVRPEEIVAAMGELVTDVDRAALTGENLDHLVRTFHHALAAGIAGWRDDDLAFVRDWGFSPGDIRVPVTVWQGARDAMVPPAHGRWLGAHIPGATLRFEPAEGHLSLWNHLDDILAGLLPQP